MRPVRRRASPISGDFAEYQDAKPHLISRLGSGVYRNTEIAHYCSYCERRIPTNLAVEHIQPKGLVVNGIMPHLSLQGKWENFLLACVNCNSCKGDNDVVLSDVLLPDRDNTFVAYEYEKSGEIVVAANGVARTAAANTLSLVGLDRKSKDLTDENDKIIALDRVQQRLNIWTLADLARQDYDLEPNSQGTKNGIISSAILGGHFSIWMKAFEGCPEIRRLLIETHAGTSESGCFNLMSTAPVSPAPNNDSLPHGAKI